MGVTATRRWIPVDQVVDVVATAAGVVVEVGTGR
jgi:hypothetical protein